MKKTKSLTKTFMVALFAFAVLFAGMAYVLPQKTTSVYADTVTPTAMVINDINFYPVFDANNPLPDGVKFYKKVKDKYTEITNPTMESISEATGSNPVYYTSTSNTPIKCFALQVMHWNYIFEDVEEGYNENSTGLADFFKTHYIAQGFTSPYFTSDGTLITSGNWDHHNNSIPTIYGIKINDIAYLDVNSYGFWSTKVEDVYNSEGTVYWYEYTDEEDYGWDTEDIANMGYGIVLGEFGSTVTSYSVTYNLNTGSGTAPTTNTKYSVGDAITLPDGTGLSKDGCTFAGWSTDSTATTGNTGSYTIQSTDVVSDAITFYAIWTQNQGGGGTQSQSETWVFKDGTPDFSGITLTNDRKEFSVNFSSNDTDYDSLIIVTYFHGGLGKNCYMINYKVGDTAAALAFDTDAWMDSGAYKTITLSSSASGDLLTFLQTNATKQTGGDSGNGGGTQGGGSTPGAGVYFNSTAWLISASIALVAGVVGLVLLARKRNNKDVY